MQQEYKGKEKKDRTIRTDRETIQQNIYFHKKPRAATKKRQKDTKIRPNKEIKSFSGSPIKRPGLCTTASKACCNEGLQNSS